MNEHSKALVAGRRVLGRSLGWLMIWVAGLIARRIVAWVNVGDGVARGQRLGLIQYGSRCDLYLPLAFQITVAPGDRVVGGEMIVATHSLATAGATKPLRRMEAVSQL